MAFLALCPASALAQTAELPSGKPLVREGQTNRQLLGGSDLFEVIHDIRAMDYKPKPLRSAYEGLLGGHGIDPARAVMFDDLDKNLLVPHEMGMTTVHVVADADYAHAQVEPWELAPATGPHVHHRTNDLAGFLTALP